MLLRRPRQLRGVFFCASLGLLGAPGSRCCGGDALGGLGCDGVDLRFGGVRVGDGAQFLDEGLQLLPQELDHARDLATNGAGALLGCAGSLSG